ncbi:Hypothetical predicted protein [Pelobates cultripes]|uniref:Uncharacterized protein n=1 Tax=Pelobates cultripes TaxID=61616 RepID=A0AAD1TEC2_PELCU|nr:Hypothetical predicted protein [Pelobates cultripes]
MESRLSGTSCNHEECSPPKFPAGEFAATADWDTIILYQSKKEDMSWLRDYISCPTRTEIARYTLDSRVYRAETEVQTTSAIVHGEHEATTLSELFRAHLTTLNDHMNNTGRSANLRVRGIPEAESQERIP